jgi:hypothetical protein
MAEIVRNYKTSHLVNFAYYLIFGGLGFFLYITRGMIPGWIVAPVVAELVVLLALTIIGAVFFRIAKVKEPKDQLHFTKNTSGGIVMIVMTLLIISAIISWKEFIMVFSPVFFIFVLISLVKAVILNYARCETFALTMNRLCNNLFRNVVRWGLVPMMMLLLALFILGVVGSSDVLSLLIQGIILFLVIFLVCFKGFRKKAVWLELAGSLLLGFGIAFLWGRYIAPVIASHFNGFVFLFFYLFMAAYYCYVYFKDTGVPEKN